MNRIAMLALSAGIVVGTAYGQAEPYGGPPGAQDPNDVYWPQADASYDRCVWFPSYVQAGWRPYSLGRWVESDQGWTWVPDEPFGWATCHYGVPGTGLPLAASLPYRFETKSTAVRPPMVAPVRRLSDPGPRSVAPRTKPAPRDNNEAAKPKKDKKGNDQQRPRPF